MAVGADPSRGAVPTHRRRRLDVRVVPHRRRSALRVRDWRMRTKLAAVLVIPSVAFLVLATVQTGALVSQATVLNGFAAQVGAGREITALIFALEQERDRTGGELAGLRAAPAQRTEPEAALAALRPLYDEADRAMSRFRAAAAPLGDSDASWRISYDKADEALDALAEIRTVVPAAVLSTETILGNYNRAIDALVSLLAEPSPGTDAPALTEAVLRYVQLAQVVELESRIREQLYSAARAGQYGPEGQVSLNDLRSQQLAALADFRVAATTEQIQRYERASLDPGFVAATNLKESSITTGASAPAPLEPDAWWTASQRQQELLHEVEASVLGDAVAEADSASAAQLSRTLVVAGAVLAVLLVALLASIVIGRSIARSLRMLRRQALRVAQVELPDALERLRTVSSGISDIEVPPADLRSMDEIGDVAEAFVAVHRSAVTVAVEQAIMRRNVNAMFVNLARRSQVLVERQLELLDELEREEADPDQLDNLFKLDHLAARMRRNDESLLVLAGTESTRRWNRPVPLSTVLLAATAEVEQYRRIRHGEVARLHVVGHAVADLVHLLAELLENATSFSPPDTFVQLSARAHGTDQAVIEIADEGLGMSLAALEEANELLAAPPPADVAASERMGLFVVGHLAVRQHIRVQLRGAERGLVAVVWLPAALLAPAPREDETSSPSRRVLAALTPDDGEAGGAAGPVGPVPAPSPRTAAADDPDPQSRPSRPVPVRAGDILATAGGTDGPAVSTWWSRSGGRPAAPVQGALGTPVPPQVPVTAGTNASGLPVRVPMAQLPGVSGAAPTPAVPAPRHEPDPEAVGGMLSRYYGGLRRAEAEDTTEITMPPAGAHSEGKSQ
ncbi:nitrate- and nitrite sensing domain-containing protein [Micromonospora sp. NPDC049559]|uniref:sensor histidine kinase n=1 Tax=Micromonospora sp. NPDC049559 TaxID=3155923 RepID=UPI0034208C15